MKSRDFVYWLQGYFEIHNGVVGLTADQVATVRNHLNLVFTHEIDPAMGDQKHQEHLNTVHTPNNPDIRYRC